MPVLVEEYKKCPICEKNDLPLDSRFCSECGHKLITEIICKNCQTECSADSRFCRYCGMPLITPTAQDPVDVIFPDKDGRNYKTVKIGNQIWMAENLRYDGEEHYSVDNDSNNDEKYGFLYTWENGLKACPPGWRLPTKDDFENLLSITDVDKISSVIRDSSWSEGLNSSEFGALPAGCRMSNGGFYDFGSYAYFWSSTPCGNDCSHYLRVFAGNVLLLDIYRNRAFSVRCVKE